MTYASPSLGSSAILADSGGTEQPRPAWGYHWTNTGIAYRRAIGRYFADTVSRRLNAIERREVEARFILLTKHNASWSTCIRIIGDRASFGNRIVAAAE